MKMKDENINVGCVTLLYTPHGWALHGCTYTNHYHEALAFAKELDRKANLPKRKRKNRVFV
jgi:hypothetical protein